MITIDWRALKSSKVMNIKQQDTLRRELGLCAGQRIREPISLFNVMEIIGFEETLRLCAHLPNYDKAWRSFAVGCVKMVERLSPGPRLVETIRLAERVADGTASIEDLAIDRDEIWRIVWRAGSSRSGVPPHVGAIAHAVWALTERSAGLAVWGSLNFSRVAWAHAASVNGMLWLIALNHCRLTISVFRPPRNMPGRMRNSGER
jgi:hypothetical protein